MSYGYRVRMVIFYLTDDSSLLYGRCHVNVPLTLGSVGGGGRCWTYLGNVLEPGFIVFI